MTKVKHELSRKLLTRVLSVYFVLTLVVTCGQIGTEYFSTKSHINSELRTLQNTFAASLTRSMWELNTAQTRSISEGLLQLPVVEGVQVRDENGELLANLGHTRQIDETQALTHEMADHNDGLFSYSFPLIYEFSGRTSHVGDATLYTSVDIIVDRIEVGIFFLIGNAIIKTTFLVFLFMTAFRKMLSDPLEAITRQMSEFDPAAPEASRITKFTEDDNELRLLQYSYNQVIDDLVLSQQNLVEAKTELERTYRQLDEHNLLLEQEVARKTANLSQIMLDLEQQKDELMHSQLELRKENESRRAVEEELRNRNTELANSIEVVNQAKDQLVESERLATLGGLVAGITHDVNTPIGISITAASFLKEEVRDLKASLAAQSLTQRQMTEFIDHAEQTSALLMNNLRRASELVASFKRISVDQANEAIREINLRDYLEEVFQALAPSFRKSGHSYTLICPQGLVVQCAPGAIAQLVTNMVTNSLIHGFEQMDEGRISLEVKDDGPWINIEYKDNGKGLNEEHLSRLFEAFFTTRPDEGGSGLGTHIMLNLVAQTLGGTIHPYSRPGQGLTYIIRFPRSPSAAAELQQ